jgi:hypothetical protein
LIRASVGVELGDTGYSEVGNERVARVVEHNVLRLQSTVRHVVVMRRIERVQNLEEVFDRDLKIGSIGRLDQTPEVSVWRILHHDERKLGVGIEVDDLNDVWMQQARLRLHDLRESLHDICALNTGEYVEDLFDLFDRDRSFELRLFSLIDRTVAARPDRFLAIVEVRCSWTRLGRGGGCAGA